MVKKNKNRHSQESPTIQNGGDSAESGDQKKTCSPGCRCPHIQKAVQLASIKKSLKNGCLASDCPGCIKDGVKPGGEEGVPSAGLWMCLQCGHQGCGRTEKQHALKHFQVVHSDPHCIAVNTSSWNVWCYSCETELPSEYRKKLHECMKYLKNLDCPSSVRLSGKAGSMEGNKEEESADAVSMPLSDVTNMPHGVRAPKKKMVSLPRVRGLQNLGNTCFFNSVMQCLAQTPHFLELLQDARQGGVRFCLPGGRGLMAKTEEGTGEEGCEEEEELPPLEGTLTKWGALTETLASILEELRQDEATTVNPQRLFNKLTAKCPQFAGGDQHDAHELLRHLLDEVRTEDLKRYWMAILDQYGLSRHDTNETVEGSVRAQVRAYGRQAGELWLLPDPVFRGILVSTVECQDCMHSYQRTEPFYELSLPVTTNKPQPPVMRRKAGGDDSFDLCGNVAGDAPSKHQMKKERRQQRKGRKKYQQPPQQRGARASDPSAGETTVGQDANNTAESEQSDADVEDNVEQDVALKEVRPGERLVNGDLFSNSNLCNGNASDNENIEGDIRVNESDAKKRVGSGGHVCPNKKICNGTSDGMQTGQENGTDARSVDCQNGTGEIKATDDRETSITRAGGVAGIKWHSEGVTEEEMGSNKEIKMPEALGLKEVEMEINGEVKEEKEEECAVATNALAKGETPTNGVPEDSEEIGKREGAEIENGICERASVDLMDGSNGLTCLHAKGTSTKDTPSEELSLSISAIVNSFSALGSPVSQTGSPSSVSSDVNVDLNISNLVPSNGWPVEDTDRPFSRIAFCNDDDSLASQNDGHQSLPVTSNTQSGSAPTAASEEVMYHGLPTADQLAKEMVGLSLGHDERQSPSHWDTCSAHSLEDSKDAKAGGLSLEVPLCNGGTKDLESEHLDDGDKSSTLAPRYHCADKECSIESCLNQFTLLELMTGSCKVICESCSERINKGKEGKMVATNSTKQYLVSNPPAVLVLHLKRFEVHQNMFRKTPRHVTFPMLLDIAPICNTKCRELPTIRRGQTKVLYSLYGVVQHSGTLHGGHYSAYVKVRAPVRRDDMRWCFLPTAQSAQQLDELSKGVNMPSEPVPGKWYHVSDSRVNEVNEDRVLHSQAYLLFYERVW